MTFYISINSPFDKGNTIDLEIHFDGKKTLETLIAEKLKKVIRQLKESSVNDIKSWFKIQEFKAEFNHRHYIVDNEYIPFDKTTKDKKKYIDNHLAKEINYQIIRWSEYDQLGYEILPNKYFYKYQEPESSEKLIEQFWKLEEEAETLLNEIRTL
jgi:type I restriction enzyme M protein